MTARDTTATDAASTDDRVEMEASWQDRDGNTYTVRCDEVIPAGLEYPVFGGVATNHLMHGFSGVGTPLMPTMFTYAAFWGKGDVFKNGERIDEGRIVHGMRTELVRGEDYRLVFDEGVIPTGRHFHLVVVPAVPDEEGHFEPEPVDTGFTVKNGEALGFWHVMFRNLEIEADRAAGPEDQNGPAALGEPAPQRAIDRATFAGAADQANKAQPGGQKGGNTSEETVEMTNGLNFEPSPVTIRAGQSVQWRNTSDLVHTVTAHKDVAKDPAHVKLPEDAEPFHSGRIRPGGTFEKRFEEPGEYRYFCMPHEQQGMVGRVVVEPTNGGSDNQ